MMLEVNDLMQGFVEDCLEHLDHIESSLMDIEAAGDNQDPEVVNSVFRAAHSIKGGAGMLGLDNIKALSHMLENVLHMVRSNEMTPSHAVVDVLLKGFDKLTEMVHNVADSENISIAAHVEKLVALTAQKTANAAAAKEPAKIDVGKSRIFTVDPVSLEQAKSGGNEIYLLEYDLLHDIHGKGKMPLEVLRSLTDTGRIVDCKVDFEAVGDLDAFGNSIPFYVLFATILEPKYVYGLVKLPEGRMRHIDDAGDAIHVEPLSTFREEFGSVVLNVKDRAGRISVPKHVEAHVLANLRVAMLGAIGRCTSLAVDLGGVKDCDLFFYQLLCSAMHTFTEKGVRLTIEGSLDADLHKAAASMGFGCHEVRGCLFNAA
ncbi:MAG: Hpt domain-containing protein [Proteobacteria bacterium]|nr:Hpt domain-containing protein [Pseudomonadota bacterium]